MRTGYAAYYRRTGVGIPDGYGNAGTGCTCCIPECFLQVMMHSTSRYGNARFKRVDTERIMHELDSRKIVIVTGFQGVNKYDDITTLGRGGSDTTAVALAAVLHADKCEIYTDVDGVFTADPRVVKTAKKSGCGYL